VTKGTDVAVVEFLTRLGLAALLGICIGFEREWRQKRIGLHTESLIAIGAALFTMLDAIIPGDKNRIVAGLVTGVGFLGGGVIFRNEANVSGINTAATIWATAAIGALAGFGLLWEAAVATVVVIVLNIMLENITEYISARRGQRGETIYKLTVLCNVETQPIVGNEILEAISRTPMSLQSLSRHNADGNEVELRAEVYSPRPEDEKVERFSARLLDMPGVDRAEWRSVSP